MQHLSRWADWERANPWSPDVMPSGNVRWFVRNSINPVTQVPILDIDEMLWLFATTRVEARVASVWAVNGV